MDAELGLQRSSTNPPLQTGPEESQVLTVAAGPGSSGSGTNVVPQQIALKEEFSTKINGAKLHEKMSRWKMKKDESMQEYFLIMKEIAARGKMKQMH